MIKLDEKEKLIADLKIAKEEVNLVKTRLNKANSKKESWFRQKSAIGKEIKSRIREILNFKKKRNSLTSDVKKTKEKRDELNKQIGGEVKTLNKLKEHFDSQKRLENPQALKKNIEAIELKIETEPMSFQREQAIMKDLNKLRKKYSEVKHVSEEFKDFKTKRTTITSIKKEANKLHKDIQERARESQKHHESLVELSKEIDLLRKKEKTANEEFLDEKKKYLNVNDELKEKLEELKKINKILEKYNIKVEKVAELKKKKSLKELEKEVQTKIKKKQKLTTEDILVMQSKK
ncbi:hypothetical protein CMO90_01720 [Candidatus Woesearchaeota archaeon]|mgnify:CR=1 FL=1|nr:hypothetical protein [Candidatus Woesearchaeota archaeon]